MALAALIIKEDLGFSDRGCVEQITQNPYLQYFCGLKAFITEAPFDPSMYVHFRKRFPTDVVQHVNDLVADKIRKTQPPPDVQLVPDNGYSCTEVARRLNVNHTNVSHWVREYRDQPEPPAQTSSQQALEAEVKKFRKENQRLLMERDILKKAAAFFAKESK